MLSTLEIFDLPEKYMEGIGHFPNWGKEKKDDKKGARFKTKQKKQKKNNAIEQFKKKKGLDQKKEEE